MRRLQMLSISLITLFILCSTNSIGQSLESGTVSNDSSTFLFEYDMRYIGSNTRIDPNYQYVLDYLIESIQKNPSWTVHVRGHVCCGPSKKISKRRAKKVYRFLKKNGIPKMRLTYKGYSDSLPLAFPEKTSEDEQKNRRVDFIISK